MKLKPAKAARITFDNGTTAMLEYLGAGQFHTCYKSVVDGLVYSITKSRDAQGTDDYSKEILSHPQLGVDPSPYIPPVEYLGDIDGTDRRVYRMPLYFPLRAVHTVAWGLYKRLKDARERAWDELIRETRGKMRVDDIGVMVNDRVVQLMGEPEAVMVPQELIDALQNLCDAAGNYGACYCFEFSARNLAVDAAGHLILLDVLFSLKAVTAIQKAREKKARSFAGRW